MKNKVLIPMNIQTFAEPPADPAGGTPADPAGGTPADPAGGTAPASPQINYEELAKAIAGKTAVTEDKVIRGYLEKQGLSEDQMKQAIADFKAQQAAQTPDVAALQQQAQQAQAMVQQAMVEKEAMFMAGELGVELKTMPYVLKLADLSKVTDDNGTVNQETLKTSINKVLEDLPQLKAQQDTQNSGFRQIGAGGGGTPPNIEDQLAAVFGNKK